MLVTGATGFLGRAVARALVARGRAVHALARPDSVRAPLSDLPIIWHTGDLNAPPSVVAAATQAGAGADLVHCAAVISYRTRDRELQRAVNVEGTRTVLDAARVAGLDRIVHVSSIVAVGRALGSETLDERAEWNAAGLGDYAETKREAELFALAREDLDVRVASPGAIFGPDATANTSIFLRRLAEGGLGPLVPPGVLSVLGVEDAAEGVCLALERGRRGERYLLAEQALSIGELCRDVAAELRGPAGSGRRLRPPLVAPGWLWWMAVAAARTLDRVRPLEDATPQALAMLGARWRGSGQKARAELGWQPRPFDAVLRETLQVLIGSNP